MQPQTKEIEEKTGSLFGNLFVAFDDENFKRSVELFRKRFDDNGFDLTYFKGKNCLDLGCGGGRYSIALSLLGANSVVGMDVSETGIADARKRAEKLGITNTTFEVGSAYDLPFKDGQFDCVIFSGVLMHTRYPEKAVEEISRVLNKGGMVYMLVYATEGVRWPLVSMLRNISQKIGFEMFDQALKEASLDVNKRRTYLDDLFVPLIDFYSWERLTDLLSKNGFENIERFKKGRLDHEENITAYYNDLRGFKELFEAGAHLKGKISEADSTLFKGGADICNAVLNYVGSVKEEVEKGKISEEEGKKVVMGQGHHRLTAIKR